MQCKKCGKMNEDDSIFCLKCGARLVSSEEYTIQKKSVKQRNYKWIPIVVGCVGIVIILYLSYFFAWIPQGQNLYSCVGKKLGIVKMMHPVTHQNNGNYSIEDYILIVDPDSKVVTGIGKVDDSTKKQTETYNIQGIYFNQSQKEAEKCLNAKFTSVGELGYILKSNPDYYFTVEYTNQMVSKLSFLYWKQGDREKEWLEVARAKVVAENYLDASIIYESIQTIDVQQELEECHYNYGKKLYEEGAYLDAEECFNKLTLDSFSEEKDKYLKKITGVRQIFDIVDMQTDDRCTWYAESNTTSTAHLVFNMKDIEKLTGDQNAYVVKSWDGEGDLDSLNGKAEYQLKLRRLSDNHICDAKLSLHAIESSTMYVDVSTLEIVVGENVTNIIGADGAISQQLRKPVSKYYTNSLEYNEELKRMSEIRRKYSY